MNEKPADPIRELDLLLDHYLIFDVTRNTYFVGYDNFHKHLVPRLQRLVTKGVLTHERKT